MAVRAGKLNKSAITRRTIFRSRAMLRETRAWRHLEASFNFSEETGDEEAVGEEHATSHFEGKEDTGPVLGAKKLLLALQNMKNVGGGLNL